MITESQNKSMEPQPEKQPFHFSGSGGLYHAITIFAHNIEEATKEWLDVRKPATPGASTDGLIQAPSVQKPEEVVAHAAEEQPAIISEDV